MLSGVEMTEEVEYVLCKDESVRFYAKMNTALHSYLLYVFSDKLGVSTVKPVV